MLAVISGVVFISLLGGFDPLGITVQFLLVGLGLLRDEAAVVA